MESLATLLLPLTLLANVAEASPQVSGASVWEPYCSECVFYKPYVRVFKGRGGPLIKDRGPGFISLRGLKDIYICTNGLVFTYYEITKKFGELYEFGWLYFGAHNCALYNGSPGPGKHVERMRHLVGLLLISHPQDIRKPALQMFVAPMYNYKAVPQHYQNLSSLAMISTEGECILEKAGRRIRIRASVSDEIEQSQIDALAPGEEEYTHFCALDSRAGLGWDWKSVVLVNSLNGSDPLKSGYFNDVREALIWDSPQTFKGCLEYPQYNPEMESTIAKHLEEIAAAKFDVHPVFKLDSDPFWTPERKELVDGDLYAFDPAKNQTFIEEIKKAEEEADKATDVAGKKAAILNWKKAKAKLALLDFKQDFAEIKAMVSFFEGEVQSSWDNASSKVKEKAGANETQMNYFDAIKNLSSIMNDRRFEPYNTELKDGVELYSHNSSVYKWQLKRRSGEIGRLISLGEIVSSQWKAYVEWGIKLMAELKKALLKFETTGNVGMDVKNVVKGVREKRAKGDVLVQIIPPRCFTFQRMTDSCRLVKPNSTRACMLLEARKGKGPKFEGPKDEWRKDVFDVVETVFNKVCPYIPGDFVTAVFRIMTGYLLGRPMGVMATPEDIIPGATVLVALMHKEMIENSTIIEMGEHLIEKDPFWDQILANLRACARHAQPLEFWYDDEVDGGDGIMLARKFPNGTVSFLRVDGLHVKEQADLEFAFNWVIDSGWRIFATVLGACMPSYENRIPLIGSRFYGLFLNAFLKPLRQIWMSNRDNPVFLQILGRYFGVGKVANRWTHNCMEGSFAQSGDRQMRPPRGMYVNEFSEMNFFTSGPLAGTRGTYASEFM